MNWPLHSQFLVDSIYTQVNFRTRYWICCWLNYFYNSFVLLPLELVAGAITIKYWNASINSDVFVIIFWFVVLVITMLGVRWYGEAELVFCTIKVIAVIGFIILGIVLICGGGPNHEFIGGKYWREPGPFANFLKVLLVHLSPLHSLLVVQK